MKPILINDTEYYLANEVHAARYNEDKRSKRLEETVVALRQDIAEMKGTIELQSIEIQRLRETVRYFEDGCKCSRGFRHVGMG